MEKWWRISHFFHGARTCAAFICALLLVIVPLGNEQNFDVNQETARRAGISFHTKMLRSTHSLIGGSDV